MAAPDADDKPKAEKPAAAKEGGEKAAEVHTTRDANGNVVLHLDDETQGNAGIKVANPAAAQWAPEIKGYGRVVDPAPLIGLVTELALANAVYPASSNELARLKTLTGQGNASVRALQTAEAAALRDQLAIQSARDKLALSWGKVADDRTDLPAFIQELTSLNTVLLRIDLPAGEPLEALPLSARVVSLSGKSGDADYLTPAATVDPLTQGRGFLFIINTNAARLLPGEAVTAYLKMPGNPLTGVSIPREAVVRTEGSGWVYVLNLGGDAFTRTGISLDRPTDAGFFVAKGVAATNYIVTTGAQTLLSEELKATIKAD